MEQNYVTVNVGITSDRVKTEECQNATVSLFGCRVAPNLDQALCHCFSELRVRVPLCYK